MANHVQNFLDRFSKDDALLLPLPVFWTVDISGVSGSDIASAVGNAKEKWGLVKEIDDYIGEGNILVAQEITIPSETLTVFPVNFENSGGFLPGYALNNRADFSSRLFTINFLETHEDIEHFVFRPWIIAVGIEGLVLTKLKATITIKQYGNDGNFRKGYRFHKCVPVNTEGGAALNYTNTDFIVKTVSFLCENYEQLPEKNSKSASNFSASYLNPPVTPIPIPQMNNSSYVLPSNTL